MIKEDEKKFKSDTLEIIEDAMGLINASIKLLDGDDEYKHRVMMHIMIHMTPLMIDSIVRDDCAEYKREMLRMMQRDGLEVLDNVIERRIEREND